MIRCIGRGVLVPIYIVTVTSIITAVMGVAGEEGEEREKGVMGGSVGWRIENESGNGIETGGGGGSVPG